MEQQNTQAAEVMPLHRPLGARSAIFFECKGHHYVFAPETGEIISTSKTSLLPEKLPKAYVSAYVGTETRWPEMARDAEELLGAVKPFDRWLDHHYVSGSKLLDLLGTDITASAVRVMRYLAENITARNHWFGRIADLPASLDIPPRTIERCLTELVSNDLLRRKVHGKSWPVRISVHPWYAWRGDIQGRDAALARWAGLNTANFDG